MEVSIRRRGFRMTPETAVKYIRMSVVLLCMWPPLGSKSKIIFKLFMCFSDVIALGLLFPLIYSVVYFIDDMVVILKSIICGAVIINFLIKFFIVRIYHRRFERLGAALNEFILNASDSSMLVFQKYIDKSWKFQFLMVCGWNFAAGGIVLGPLVLPQDFPTDAVYPFSVEHPLVAKIIYAHQSFVAYQCATGLAFDGQATLFMWYLNAKFEILVLEIKRVINKEDLCWCIKQHQEILLFADELIPPIRALAFTTVSVTKILMISSGFFLISDETLIVKLQFVIVAISSTFNTFLYSWAADDLINISGPAISSEIFNIFCHHSLKMKKMCLFIIHRAQKPIVINIPGFLATLSNEYYASFLSTAFSCFATIRAVVNS